MEQSCTSSAPQGLQRRVAFMERDHIRRPSVPSSSERTLPLQPYILPFYPDLKHQTDMKERSHISNIVEKCKQRLKPEKQAACIAVRHLMPLDTMDTLRISQTTYEQARVTGGTLGLGKLPKGSRLLPSTEKLHQQGPQESSQLQMFRKSHSS
ncbi:hypothetical protein DNTS_018095 [Danionella cerebrum]|uniref:Uncharacterized protein n=1 Tax=Danionella cerebrum TaxID=2873325 RepID=A0A553MZG0_9TELE|nr:hypothetical protein DNTS_018095 [Danionella translucida]